MVPAHRSAQRRDPQESEEDGKSLEQAVDSEEEDPGSPEDLEQQPPEVEEVEQVLELEAKVNRHDGKTKLGEQSQKDNGAKESNDQVAKAF